MALNNNYVKFVRGSATAWAALTEKSPDTLYFITTYGDNNEILKTEMYLGEQLISDGGSNLPSEIKGALKDLSDVNLNDVALVDGMVLSYDINTEKWVPKALESVDVEDLRAQIATLIGTIEGDDKLSVREIAAQEVAAIVDDAPEAYDTLKEISDWITNHPGDISEINSRLVSIENEIFETQVDEDDGSTITISKIDSLENELNDLQNDAIITSAAIGDLEVLLGAEKNEDGEITSLSKLETIENILGVTEGENGEIIITSAPIGNLEDLLLYQNSEDKPENLVEAINTLTDIMLWKTL